MFNYYLIEYVPDGDKHYRFYEVMAEDQYEAIEICKHEHANCVVQRVFMQLSNWRDDHDD